MGHKQKKWMGQCDSTLNNQQGELNLKMTDAKPTTAKTSEFAIFGMGWFWNPEAFFMKVKGVTETRVGYCGGKKSSPTYHSMGDHTECIKIGFDSSVLSFDDLLKLFWKQHSPNCSSSIQYRSLIVCVNEQQKTVAVEQKKGWPKASTVIMDCSSTAWTDAEEYHQQYFKKQGSRY